MISVSEASNIILSHLFEPRKEKVVLVQAIGRVLAENIIADRDFPPFDRVTMDGVALASNTFQDGARKFRIMGLQAAGRPQTTLTLPETCIEVMTGTQLPAGADTVVRYEDLEVEDGIATIIVEKISAGENIHVRAVDAKAGDILLTPGIKISAAEIALCASVGKKEMDVYAFPKTAVVSTGDELVAIDQTPLPHQIRRSNASAVAAALYELGCTVDHFHVPDQEEALKKDISAMLRSHELIILIGGVSKGKFDFVPQVLESAGIRKLFHQVSQKPGKPFWFGTSAGHTVFALPGNPVSTHLCFYRYIKPWLLKSFGAEYSFPSAVMATDFSFPPPLTYFLQVRIEDRQGVLKAYPHAGHGSGDFANLKDADGFLELPADRAEFRNGEVFPFIPFRGI